MRDPRPTYEDLVALVQQQRRQIEALQAEVGRLTAALEEAVRAGQRQAAPFRQGPPKPDPQPPGRKPGDAHGRHGHRPPPPPGQVQETCDAALPDACPHCGGGVVTTAVVEQYQTEIPRQPIRRRFRIPVGQYQRCGKRVQGRHPLQTSDALGAAASQLGPDAQAAVVLLNKQAGLSHGQVAACFRTLFGIDVTRGASAQITRRAGARLRPADQEVRGDLPASAQVSADETGWRIGGHPAGLHAWVGDRATCYALDPQRSAAALEQVLGRDWDGVLVRDGWASYDRFTAATHQQCVAHVLRRAQALLAVATRGAVRFPRQVIALFTAAVHLKNRFQAGAVPVEAAWATRDAFDEQLLELAARPRAVPA